MWELSWRQAQAQHHFPTTQGATFTGLGEAGRETRVLGAFAAGPRNPGVLRESALQSSFGALGPMACCGPTVSRLRAASRTPSHNGCHCLGVRCSTLTSAGHCVTTGIHSASPSRLYFPACKRGVLVLSSSSCAETPLRQLCEAPHPVPGPG